MAQQYCILFPVNCVEKNVMNQVHKIFTKRMSLQYSLVNHVLYAIDATMTARSLQNTHKRNIK